MEKVLQTIGKIEIACGIVASFIYAYIYGLEVDLYTGKTVRNGVATFAIWLSVLIISIVIGTIIYAFGEMLECQKSVNNKLDAIIKSQDNAKGKQAEENPQIPRIEKGEWQCPNCKIINEKTFIRCLNCNEPRPQ